MLEEKQYWAIPYYLFLSEIVLKTLQKFFKWGMTSPGLAQHRIVYQELSIALRCFSWPGIAGCCRGLPRLSAQPGPCTAQHGVSARNPH
jgi:hypothetical protein